MTYADVLRGRRDGKGRRVREVWIEWAIEQPDPKPSWLVPYDELSEADKEADRRIGSVLWGDGFMTGVNMGLEMAYELMNRKAGGQEGESDG
jgi:hypothetical protein